MWRSLETTCTNLLPALAAAVLVTIPWPALHAAPFRGTPFVPSCLIEAEDFDTGGEGVGYHVAAALAAESPYRADRVSITGSPNNYVVNLEADEWIAFTIEVPQAAAYDVEFMGLYGLGHYVFALDLVGTAGTKRLATWGGGTALATEFPIREYFISQGVTLPAGRSVLRLTLVTADWSLFRQGASADWMRLSQPAPVGTWTPLAGADAAGFADGPGSSARFAGIVGLAADEQSNVYVADAGNRRVRQVAPDGTVRTLAGSGAAGSQDGPADQASFRELRDVGVDRARNVIVLDGVQLRKLAPAGFVSTIADIRIPTEDFSYHSNVVEHTAEEHYRVSGLAVDRGGQVHVLGTTVATNVECWQGPFGPKCNLDRRTRTGLFVLEGTGQWVTLLSRELLYTDHYMGVPGECGSSLRDLSPASGEGVVVLEEHYCRHAAPYPLPTSGWALLGCRGMDQTNTLRQAPGADWWTGMPIRPRMVGDGSFVCLDGSTGNLMWLKPGWPTRALPGEWPTNAVLAIGPRQEIYLATGTRIHRYAWPEGPLFAFLLARVVEDRLLLRVTAPAGRSLRLEGSADLENWTSVQDFAAPGGAAVLEVTRSAPQCFFRVSHGP